MYSTSYPTKCVASTHSSCFLRTLPCPAITQTRVASLQIVYLALPSQGERQLRKAAAQHALNMATSCNERGPGASWVSAWLL